MTTSQHAQEPLKLALLNDRQPNDFDMASVPRFLRLKIHDEKSPR